MGAPPPRDRSAGRRTRRERRGCEPPGPRARAQRRRLRPHRWAGLGPVARRVHWRGAAARPAPLAAGRGAPGGAAHVRRGRDHAAGHGPVIAADRLLPGMLSGVAWARDRRAMVVVVGAIVLVMFVWITWQFAVGSAVQEWLDDEQGTERTGLFPPIPGRRRDHLARQRDLLRRRHRRWRGLVARGATARPAPGAGEHDRRPGQPPARAGRRRRAAADRPRAARRRRPTTSRSSASRPARHAGCSTATPTPRGRPCPTSSTPRATRSPRCARLLGTLRESGRGGAGRARRVRRTRASATSPAWSPRCHGQGLAVSLDVVETHAGAADRLPRAIGLAVYRTVAGGADQRPPPLHGGLGLRRRAGSTTTASYAEVEVSTTADRATARPAAGWASSASASARPPTAARSTSDRGSPGATGCACATRWEPPHELSP